MGKSFRKGHSFPTSSGFTGSSGKVASIKPYTRRVATKPKGAAISLSSPPSVAGALTTGHSLVHRARPLTQLDALHGGKNPLLAGYKKGGKVK